MKKTKILIASAIVCIATFVAIAADHIDAPAVNGGGSSSLTDITDFYAFQGSSGNSIAFVANVQGFIAPGSATDNATFDENVVIEINIDTDGDASQDLVIQAIPRDGRMYFFGPFASTSASLSSTINTTAALQGDVAISGQTAVTENSNGIQYFAGPRDDPFFFDFVKYSEIIGGTATSFDNPGDDTFASTNVLSVVVEVPKSMIGGTGSINTWVETKRK